VLYLWIIPGELRKTFFPLPGKTSRDCKVLSVINTPSTGYPQVILVVIHMTSGGQEPFTSGGLNLFEKRFKNPKTFSALIAFALSEKVF